MSQTVKNLRVPYVSEGVIRSAQLSDTVAPENSCQLAVNMHFDRIGSFQTRLGITNFATQLAGSVKNFGTLSIQSTGVRRLFAQVGTDVSVWNGATWTSVRTLSTAANKARFAQYLNYTWMVNGNTTLGGDPVAASNGGAFATTYPPIPQQGAPSTFPPADFIQAGFEGRVWLFDKSNDAIYFSDIVQFTPPATYNFATPNPVANFVKNLSPQDGESITGVFRVPRALLLFKQNHIYRIYGSSSIDAYPAYNVGTYSNESIVQAKDGLYFHHPSGFYKFSYDNQPTEISKRVIDFVNAIPRANYDNIVGIYDNKDHVEWAVGSITVEGVTYQNCMMRYTISTQVWTIYDLATGITPTALILYDDGTNIHPIVGTSTGVVAELDLGKTDLGAKIYFEYISRWMSLTEMYAHAKALSGMMVHAENAAGAQVQYQTDKDFPNVWTDIDTMDENYASLFPNMSTTDFNRLRFRIKGFSSGDPIIFNGVEFLSLQDKGLNEN